MVGRLFDAALAPTASLGALLPLLKRLAALALAQWALEITVGFLFARARWRQECAARVRLMAAVLRQEPAFFDAQAPGELASRLLSEPQRLQEAANRGPERAVRAALTVVGPPAFAQPLRDVARTLKQRCGGDDDDESCAVVDEAAARHRGLALKASSAAPLCQSCAE